MQTLSQELLGDLLRQVSRSFHLSLKFLPAPVRVPISLAYLLARTSDTIADTDRIPLQDRLAALQRFAELISGSKRGLPDYRTFAGHQGNPAEGELLQRSGDALALLNELSDSDRTLVRQVLATIISGQKLDLERFAGASESNIVALTTAEELEDYTYRVAGCVGEFWTRICFTHLKPQCRLTESEMIPLGVRFGKGLQLVNILRDLPADLRQGRCYLPSSQLDTAHLNPQQLLGPASETSVRPLYNSWLDKAARHLADGWTYTNTYPRSLARVRISCALPVILGQRTIRLLRTGSVLDPAVRIKVPRHEVRSLVLQVFLKHPFPQLWHRLASQQG